MLKVMMKSCFNKICKKDLYLVMILAFIPNFFQLIMNLPFYISLASEISLGSFLLTLFINFFAGMFLFSVIQIWRYLYLIICFVIFMCNCGLLYFKKVYSAVLTGEIAEYILHSDAQGILDHLDYQIYLWILVFAIIPSLILYYISKKLKFIGKVWLCSWFSYALITMILAMVSALNIKGAAYDKESLAYVVPYSYIIIILEASIEYSTLKEEVRKNDFVVEKNPNHKALKIILIVGESARYDHFSVNGYQRETSPELAKINNLVTFSDAYSLGTFTTGAVPKIFRNEQLKHHVSLIKLMEMSGFKTYWISNHRMHGDVITNLAHESQFALFRDDIHSKKAAYKFDDKLLVHLDDIMNKNANENIFLVLHMIGSHLNYDMRYPDEFKKFTPTCKQKTSSFFGRISCTDSIKLNNSYDNSILYSDYIISGMIKRLENENALVLFVSDHGQSLGENGVFFHGDEYEKAPEEQIHVAMFLWASDNFLADKTYKYNYLKAKAKKDKHFTHGNIFHSLPHCIGLTKNIHAPLSICH